MRLEVRKYLHDIQQATARLARFTTGKSFDDYANDDLVRAAVERQFEIIGEALSQLARLDANIAASITQYRRIIAFRNILVHGYADVDDLLVWDIVETKLPTLTKEINALLGET